MSDPFIGEIRMFGGNFAPRGWAFCNGQLLSIAQNSALFSILGTTYGGNGVSTFGLPDLRGRSPMQWGQGPGLSPRTLGEQGGSETVTLISSQMPQHSHQLVASVQAADAANPEGMFDAVQVDPNTQQPVNNYNATAGTTMNAQAIGIAGGSQPHNNMEPFLCVSFIIALQGVYPSRN
ncbi:phage tail protein [Myxococcaceae bacterium JPH2]|nr:phage tail protein [Myxococcaceae bacterium JPH2]